MLSRGYTCDFLPALETGHPQNCCATKVKGGCTYSHVPPIYETCQWAYTEYSSFSGPARVNRKAEKDA